MVRPHPRLTSIVVYAPVTYCLIVISGDRMAGIQVLHNVGQHFIRKTSRTPDIDPHYGLPGWSNVVLNRGKIMNRSKAHDPASRQHFNTHSPVDS